MIKESDNEIHHEDCFELMYLLSCDIYADELMTGSVRCS